MSVIVLPDTMPLGAGSGMGQARYDVGGASDLTGSDQVRLFGPPRWTLALRSPEHMAARDAGRWMATAVRLRGRVNVLEAGDPARLAPQGNARGTLTLASAAAAGDTAIAIAGARPAPNLLRGGNFRWDGDADGLGNWWAAYWAGGISSATYARGFGPSPYAQRVTAGATAAGSVGIRHADLVPVVAGQAYTLSFDLLDLAYSATHAVYCYVGWYDASDAFLSSAIGAVSYGGDPRKWMTATAPSGAAKAMSYIWVVTDASNGPGSMVVDRVQFEAGSAPTAPVSRAQLLAGDLLQLGSGLGTSQLVMVAADADDDSSTTLASVPIEPPLRLAFGPGAAVTWDRPVAYWRLMGEQTSWTWRTDRVAQGMAMDLLETWTL